MTAIEEEKTSTEASSTDTTVRSRVTMADGRTHDIREKYTTAKRYIEKAHHDKTLAQFSLTPTSRVSVNPAAVVDIVELER